MTTVACIFQDHPTTHEPDQRAHSLQYGGYNVVLSTSAESLVPLLANNEVDIIVTQTRLHRHNAGAHIRALREVTDLPIIVVSISQSFEQAAKDAGATEFCAKKTETSIGQLALNAVQRHIPLPEIPKGTRRVPGTLRLLPARSP